MGGFYASIFYEVFADFPDVDPDKRVFGFIRPGKPSR